MRKCKILLSALLILILVCLIVPTPGYAVGTCGPNATWNVLGTTMTISGTGPISIEDSAPWSTMRSVVTEVIIEPGITAIGDKVFQNFTALTAITLPDSVTEVGASAFSGCKQLTHIELPVGLLSLGSRAFASSGLLSITLPENVTRLNEYLFFSCKNLKEVNLSPRTCIIGASAFSECGSLAAITIPSTLYQIDEKAFNGCRNLEEVYIEDLISWLGITFHSNPLEYHAKLYVEGVQLTDLVIPEGITKVPARAFIRCAGLKSVTIPQGVISIGTDAFSYCPDLTEISLPNSLQRLTGFEGCSYIQTVHFDGTLQEFQKYNPGKEFVNAELYLTIEGASQSMKVIADEIFGPIFAWLQENGWKIVVITLLIVFAALAITLGIITSVVDKYKRQSAKWRVKKNIK